VDSNHHGPNGPQGPQPDPRGVDGSAGVQIVHFASVSGGIGSIRRHDFCQAFVTPARSSATLSARKEPGKTRERTVYTLTDKGLQALQEYARTPVAFTPLKSEALIRLLICDLVGEEVTRESMTTL
jgi:hypothetical protein